jgi:hypothetical protein
MSTTRRSSPAATRISRGSIRRRVERDLAQLHVGTTGNPKGVSTITAARISTRCRTSSTGACRARGVPVDAADVPLQRLVLRPGRWPPTPV